MSDERDAKYLSKLKNLELARAKNPKNKPRNLQGITGYGAQLQEMGMPKMSGPQVAVRPPAHTSQLC